MKAEDVTLCDVCKKQIATNECSLCGKDLCPDHTYGDDAPYCYYCSYGEIEQHMIGRGATTSYDAREENRKLLSFTLWQLLLETIRL